MLTNRQLFQRYLGQTSSDPMLLEVVRADGIYLYGPGDERYIDLISGVSVSNTGHCHPRVTSAVKKQVDSYMHLMVYGEIIQAPQVQYAEYLTGMLPDGLDICYFVNSGSEAVEGAMKLAKRYTGRSRIFSFYNSYHGSTHGALSIQGSERYKRAFRPLLPDTCLLPFNDEGALSAIDDMTACVIVEPVQAEAGVIYPEEDFLARLRERCIETGALLVFDEVQTGFGRTGYMFATDRFNIVPDIILLAKALGGGMPLGAFISSEKVMKTLISDPSLGHLTTFGGHPVSCAAGLESLKVIVEENLPEASRIQAEIFKKELRHPLVTEIRGEGLLLAVQLADKHYVRYAINHATNYGLILDYFLFCEDAFRISPPLIISNEEVLYACGQLKKLLDAAKKSR